MARRVGLCPCEVSSFFKAREKTLFAWSTVTSAWCLADLRTKLRSVYRSQFSRNLRALLWDSPSPIPYEQCKALISAARNWYKSIRFVLFPTAIVRPLSSLAKFSFVISNIRFLLRTGPRGGATACQSPCVQAIFCCRRHSSRSGVVLVVELTRGRVRIPKLATGVRHAAVRATAIW